MFTVNHSYVFLHMFALWFLVKFVLEIFISLRAVVFIVLWIHLKVKHCQFKHWLKWWMTICKKCLLLDLPFRAMQKSFHLLYFWYQNLRFDLKINPSFINTLCIKILFFPPVTQWYTEQRSWRRPWTQPGDLSWSLQGHCVMVITIGKEDLDPNNVL